MRRTHLATALALLALLAAAACALNPREVAKRLDPSVVRIYIIGPQGMGSGTGFVVNREGYVATNFHVVELHLEMSWRIVVVDPGAGEEDRRSATLVEAFPGEDLAVLRVEGLERPPVTFAALADDWPAKGGQVYAIGFPGASDRLGPEDEASFATLRWLQRRARTPATRGHELQRGGTAPTRVELFSTFSSTFGCLLVAQQAAFLARLATSQGGPNRLPAPRTFIATTYYPAHQTPRSSLARMSQMPPRRPVTSEDSHRDKKAVIAGKDPFLAPMSLSLAPEPLERCVKIRAAVCQASGYDVNAMMGRRRAKGMIMS